MARYQSFQSETEYTSRRQQHQQHQEQYPSQSSPRHLIKLAPPVCQTTKQEWWNAVFGCHWNPSTSRHSQGLAGFDVTKSQQLSIAINDNNHTNNNNTNNSDSKLGVTVSRLALGVSVTHVQPDSPAALVGIPLHSVLLEINGIPLLADPTRTALERLWQYQGCVKESTSTNNPQHSSHHHHNHRNNNNNNNHQHNNHHHHHHHHGDTPSAAATSSSSSSSSASSSNTPSNIMSQPVQLKFIRHGRIQTYLLAHVPPWGISWGPCGQFALVKRVQGRAEQMGVKRGSLVAAVDQHTALDHAAAAFQLQQPTCRTLTLAWPPANARSHRRSVDGDDSSGSRGLLLSSQMVEGVHIKVHPVWTSRTPSLRHSDQDLRTKAEQVAAGLVTAVQDAAFFRNVEPPRPKELFAPCPQLKAPDYFQALDPFHSALFCWNWVESHLSSSSSFSVSEVTTSMIQTHGSNPEANVWQTQHPQTAYLLTLPLLSFLCFHTHDDTDVEHQPKMLTLQLLKLSRQDPALQQYLYFCLRSYISTLETRRDGNLMALLHCLELLRYAEKELARRQVGKDSPDSAGDSAGDEDEEDLMLPASNTIQVGGVVEPPMDADGDEANSHGTMNSSENKRFLGFFRKKKKKRNGRYADPPLTTVHPLSLAPSTPTSAALPTETPEIPSSPSQTPSTMYENMSDFLSELDRICVSLERLLQKSFRQKLAEWAVSAWSVTKDTALAGITKSMRESLSQPTSALINPVDPSQFLTSIQTDECFILPSAHFPILLTFQVDKSEESMFRTRVDLHSVTGVSPQSDDLAYVVHMVISGSVRESRPSHSVPLSELPQHQWNETLNLDTRSEDMPTTLSVRLSSHPKDDDGVMTIVGFGWVDLRPSHDQQQQQQQESSESASLASSIPPSSPALQHNISIYPHPSFDPAGDCHSQPSPLTIQLSTTLQTVPLTVYKRQLLYKHDDDLRQEAFAVQFIQICDRLLQARGLDLQLLTYSVVPVGTRRGFVEWVPNSVPLSELCKGWMPEYPSMVRKANLTKDYESLRANSPNPIQDFLRAHAYDPEAPYWIAKDTMDRYVQSCAGYTVLTYLLGVGDRHLDNLLLHSSGAFFHCDYSFLLGSDPKTYLPLRLTSHMVAGMGGFDADGYTKFVSWTGAAFLCLRQSESVHLILCFIRLMEASCCLPNDMLQRLAQVRERLRLDLSDQQALEYMEGLLEDSVNNKMWIAVDTMHTIGKHIH